MSAARPITPAELGLVLSKMATEFSSRADRFLLDNGARQVLRGLEYAFIAGAGECLTIAQENEQIKDGDYGKE